MTNEEIRSVAETPPGQPVECDVTGGVVWMAKEILRLQPVVAAALKADEPDMETGNDSGLTAISEIVGVKGHADRFCPDLEGLARAVAAYKKCPTCGGDQNVEDYTVQRLTFLKPCPECAGNKQRRG